MTNQRTILLVDDAPANIELLSDLLAEAHEVRFALSGAEALRIASEEAIDLILLDVMMPEMDGYEVCSRLKADPRTRSIPVIFVTALSETEDEAKGLELGAVDYLVKPISPSIVLARVKNHLALLEHVETQREHLSELERLNREKNELFSLIAHDLRGPFTALLALSGFMSEGVMSLSLKDLVTFSGRINDAAQRVFRLLENLLEWARLQMGSLPIEPLELNLQDLSNEMMGVYLSMASEKGVELTSTVPAATVFADSHALGTVIRNLTHNALKFTPSGGSVTLNACEREAMLEFSVVDSGVGMTPDKLGQLFRMGGERSTPGTHGEKGTGLGLILVKELVEKNGGQFEVESTEGVGTTFRFTVPKA